MNPSLAQDLTRPAHYILLMGLAVAGCAQHNGTMEFHRNAASLPDSDSPDDEENPQEPPRDDADEDDEPVVTQDTWHVSVDGEDETADGTRERPYQHIQSAIDNASDGAVIIIHDGTYTADAYEAADPTCGNCDDDDFYGEIPITIGFIVADKTVHLQGESREGTVLDTGAGYGVLFTDAGSSSIQNLTVTGGIRDADARATDAAIVVRYTDLLVSGVDIIENNDRYQGELDPIVGIMGITAREGAILTVDRCRILNNSWDGITLYRSDPAVKGSAPRGHIQNSAIGCTEDCVFNNNGRGVGIGVTWDARATIQNNRVHDYWKGIGSFGTAEVMVRNNIVSGMHGWGIIASGESTMVAQNNTIVNNGNVGLAAWNEGTSGAFINNIVVNNGHTDEWVAKQAGVWLNDGGAFEFAYNDVWNNQGEDVCTGGIPGGEDCSPIEFQGIDGNFSEDPAFIDTRSFSLEMGSPAIDAGDPDIHDTDGSRSDVGVHGGPLRGELP